LRRLLTAFGVLIAVVVLAAGVLLTYHEYFAHPALSDVPAIDQDGRPARLSDFRGRWVLVFFGYTHCPDVCPNALSGMASAFRELGPRAEKVQGLLVTVDPGRDKPATLKKYVSYFDSRLAAFYLPEPELARFAGPFGAQYARPDKEGHVDHSAYFYLVNPRGVLGKEPLAPPLSAADLEAAMRSGG